MTALDPALATKVARAELWKRILIVVTAAMVATVLGLLLVVLGRVSDIVIAIRETQQSGSPAVKAATEAATSAEAAAVASQETNDQILDCLQPEGECFKRSQERTAGVVGQIGAGNILAVVCALQVPNGTPLAQALEQVTSCVAKQLANARPDATP